MSQVLQCTQFAALICRRGRVLPSGMASSTISYTLAGQKRVQGLSYSSLQRVTQMDGSETTKWTGWSSSYSVAAKYTLARRSRGGRVRCTYSRFGGAYSPILCRLDQSAEFFSVQGERPAVAVSQLAFNSPNQKPFLKPGLTFRTFFSSAITGDARSFASKPALSSFCARCSAASMPLRIAWCVPLILGTLSRPAVSPISSAPGISTFGMDW